VSGAVDDDVARTVADGRETLGAMLSTAQTHLQKAFIAFVIGFLGTFYLLRAFIWNRMKADLNTHPEIQVIAVTPFDVILLQVKIGLVAGILLAVPVVLYYSRDALRKRGRWPADRIPRWQLATLAVMSSVLFLGGVAYAYTLFFPLMLNFLAGNAFQAGFEPKYSIVKWSQFIFLLTLSFGLAAQLPLAMSGLSYLGIVRYETFRDKWRYAVLAIFLFGALFSPPDPFTQIMWAAPLLVLYAFSVGLARFVVTVKRSSERVGIRSVARDNWNAILGVGMTAAAAVYLAFAALLAGAADPYLRQLPVVGPRRLADPSPVLGLSPTAATALTAAVVGGVAAVIVLLYHVNDALDGLAQPDTATAPASEGAPDGIDLDTLDAGGVRAAPPEAFADLSEDEAVAIAGEALDAGDDAKAEAVLDRFDEVHTGGEAQPAGGGPSDDAGDPAAGTESVPEEETDEDGNVLTRTGAGMVDAFTEDETTEEDIGGYAYDIAFVLDSLTSKTFRIAGLFALVLASTFVFLYRGGIGEIKRDFLARLPAGVTPDQVGIVALHPVEALIFEIKVATIIAGVATLPLVLYYAWPALKQRGFASGNRNVLVAWAGAMFAGLVVGSFVGYAFVAPTLISYLVADAVTAGMIIAYRINNFGWLIFFTTVGVGLLADVPVTMVLFHRGGLVGYGTMRRRWREITLAVFAVAAIASPRGVFTMFLFGIPIMLSYGLGLTILWVYTLGGRRTVRGARSQAD